MRHSFEGTCNEVFILKDFQTDVKVDMGNVNIPTHETWAGIHNPPCSCLQTTSSQPHRIKLTTLSSCN